MSRTVYDLIGLAAGIAFILALKGLSHPKTARRGNLIGAFGAGLATLVVFFYSNEGSSLPLNNLGWILGAIAVGLIIGVPAARKVQMTQMPQLVALFNGVGGGAAALVAIVEYLNLVYLLRQLSWQQSTWWVALLLPTECLRCSKEIRNEPHRI